VIQPGEADVEVPVGSNLLLALRGRPLAAADRRVLSAFASYAAVALDQQRLAAEAEAASRSRPRTGCGPPSGSATPTTPLGWGSAWRCLAG
jgi:GAF domain-containing protein